MSKTVQQEFSACIQEITKYYEILVVETKNNKIVGSTNEWILDNYFVISEQEKALKEDFRNKEIQKIKVKRKKQISDFIFSLLEESNFQIDINSIFRSINTYQEEKDDYFSYIEIGFILVIIKCLLLRQLGTLSQTLRNKLHKKQKAEAVFNQIEKEIDDSGTFSTLKSLLNNEKTLLENKYYLEQLYAGMQDIQKFPESIQSRIKEVLNQYDKTFRAFNRSEIDESAASNILMMNIFVSLKKMTKIEMSEMLDQVSFTEKVLMSEKVDMYNHMYDNNKDNYRSQIIRKAKKHKMTEYQYVLGVVEKANKGNRHVGWYLFAPKNYKRRSISYASIISVITVLSSAVLAYFLDSRFVFFLLLIPVSQIIIELFNQVLRFLHTSRSTFKLKFEDGLPKEYATMVIIPTIIKNANKVNEMFDKLEIYYLSNLSDNLYFTLLGDCSSEDTKETSLDNDLMEAGLSKVRELNEKYGKQIFNFVYRNRFYSEGEGCFLGFERKRGAILHFNDLLLGNLSQEQKNEYFRCQTLDNFHEPITYIITLDTDTELVLYSAFSLIGAMAHPMNHPVLSADGKTVVSGYGIMQPRINVDVKVTNKSRYAQMFAGLGGLDIYTTASFEVYQDIFNEGSFVGKGIYHLKTFQRVLSGAFPQNLVLSHDLLEGNYLRCGLINDVELFDDYPSNYLDDAKRHHRWTRGDWQIIQWLKKKVKNEQNEKTPNPINFLGKWKITDNLRRSLLSFNLLALLFYGFTIGKLSSFYYLLIVVTVVATPIFFYLVSRLVYKQKYSRGVRYYMSLFRGLIAVLNKSVIVLSLLPKEAFMYVDAIVRSIYRMTVSKKNMLNWITSEEAEKMTKKTLKGYFLNFRINFVAAIALALLTGYFRAETHPWDILWALIIGVFWCFAPVILYLFGRKIKDREKRLNEKELAEIRDIVFRTWKYFDTLLTEEFNYLIPDNYQLSRTQKTDYKTSPTNIGYSLTSTIAAYELEFIDKENALHKLSNIIETVARLKKWEGHLFNWYDIHTLEELNPYFVSAADSGNFVACLYVVQGFLEKIKEDELLLKVKKLIDETNFSKLYNHEIDVFSIGFDYREGTLLPYHYNNFASESRLTGYIAICKGDVPYKHWFCLDKTLTKYKRSKGIASWYGTLFEYFMPLIFMKTYRHTLMDETYSFACYVQREFIKEVNKDLPWGISESGYHELDDALNYKYRAFGVPYLKFQNTISNRIVISPYSSMMTISVDDKAVYENIQKFKRLKVYGEFGFYESYDEEDNVVVEAHYAHHQGMIVASLANYLKDNCIQKYFHTDKRNQSMEMLLEEKAQIKPYIDLKITKYKRYQYSKERQENDIREYDSLGTIPDLGVLSNGFYNVSLNDRGTGISRYKSIYINRFRKVTSESYGMFFYIRNMETDDVWSNTYAPLNEKPDKYRVIFASDRIKYIREDKGIVTNTEVAVIKDSYAEIRKLTFENHTSKDVRLEVTSYGEVIMARVEEDVIHRTFNGITIFSEIDHPTSSLIFIRKSRTKENVKYYVINRMFLREENGLKFEYETSRSNFIGRNNTTYNPKVIKRRENLTQTVGYALDPIMSFRREIIVKAGSKESVYWIAGFGKSREQVMKIVNTYNTPLAIESAFEMATVLNNMRTRYAQLKAPKMRQYNNMLKHVFQTSSTDERRREVLTKNTLSQNALWRFGISGDFPIIVLEINTIERITLVKELLHAYEFYKSRGLNIDVVIINDEQNENKQILNQYITYLVNKIYYFNYFEDSAGNVYTISGEDINESERILLLTIARISLNASTGKTLEKQIQEMEPKLSVYSEEFRYPSIQTKMAECPKDLKFYNEIGGFIQNGKEYLITQINTPTPWVNVIANEKVGFVISNAMSGFTYAYNSQNFKITTWSNDIVSDPPSEILLINNQRFTPASVRHGMGYSIFNAETDNLEIKITVFVAREEPVKYYVLDIKNTSNEHQSLNLEMITKLVLGDSEEKTCRHLLSNLNEAENRLYFRNVYSTYFKDYHAFLSSTEKIVEIETDKPTAKSIKILCDVPAQSDKQMAFMIGCQKTGEHVPIHALTDIQREYSDVCNYWNRKLSAIQVSTPDESFNYAVNAWFLYQTYAARLYARAGFYQVGGAFGFRDQLQDSMSILYSDEQYARRQILKHAAHQFPEGDVLHWWHEELNLGSRTTFSDDYLWLIFVTHTYICKTGDYSILDELVPYVQADKLQEGKSEESVKYVVDEKKDTLYNHLKLCIDKALRQMGAHNLPLMGCGDWNDGMNKVGYKGKGESVWVAFFLLENLRKIINLSQYKQDNEFTEQCNNAILSLKQAISEHAWDGEWFLRAYFDNGDPLGSRNNTECQIDLLTQSWGLLTEMANDKQKELLLRETEARLVDREHKLIRLLTPSFKNSKNNPGYIMDYLKGIRENGGQYTHAAMWYIIALIKEGFTDRAYHYFSMINPINRTASYADALRYKAEPYSISADIYSNPQHAGRGGWTWYSGSSGWAYKVAIEHILGFKKQGNQLIIEPKIPSSWNGFSMSYRYFETLYSIIVQCNNSKEQKNNTEIYLDGLIVKDGVIILVNDGKEHEVVIKK